MSVDRDSVAWITGGSSGIGLAAARAIGRLGARVFVSGRRADALQDAVRQLEAAGIRAGFRSLDVADSDACTDAANEIVERCGRLDVLVNSAGLNIARRNWSEVDPDGWNDVFRINVDGTFHCIRAALPAMRARHAGLIVNVSSWAGRFDSQAAGPAYSAAKHAVSSMTRSLNLEEAVNGIRATALCPGEVATPIMRKRKVPPSPERMAEFIQLEDIEDVFTFIAAMPARACVHELVISPTKR